MHDEKRSGGKGVTKKGGDGLVGRGHKRDNQNKLTIKNRKRKGKDSERTFWKVGEGISIACFIRGKKEGSQHQTKVKKKVRKKENCS